MKHPELHARFLELVTAAPVGVTSLDDPQAARAVLVDDALTAIAVVHERSPASIVDIGSGGGSPGIPLAIETGVPTTLLESRQRKCEFLRATVSALGLPIEVIEARSEDVARGTLRDGFELATARALAPPPVAVELGLPLVAPGGCLVLWTAAVDIEPLRVVAQLMAGEITACHAVSASRRLVVVDKLGPTPDRFPRRPGMARKRPLASLPSDA